MKKTLFALLSGLVIVFFLIWMLFNSNDNKKDTIATVKVALRNVGHQLLLTNKDSTSLILPVKALNETTYLLSFSNELSFNPDDLVTIVQHSLNKTALSKHYIVEVVNCIDKEIAYSFEMQQNEDNAIIPCKGRTLLNKCYTIELKFIDIAKKGFNTKLLLYFLGLGILTLLFLVYRKVNQKEAKLEDNNESIKIGSFYFYPEQNKLLKKDITINLSKKECELLSIFIAKPNQIIKREELTKKVWEDNGVFVSRSLDTYISKLRKKLKDDDTIKLTNIHGVGYKLEINN